MVGSVLLVCPRGPGDDEDDDGGALADFEDGIEDDLLNSEDD